MMAAPVQSHGHRLRALLAELAPVQARDDILVTGLTMDSRSTAPGDLFLACRGYRQNGWQYIDEAIRAGAAAVLVEADAARHCARKALPVIPVVGLREKAGIIADRFFGHPSGDLTVIGITGTDGKTSVSYFLGEALARERAGVRGCGVIGTLGYGLFPELRPGIHTTPDPVTIQGLLASMTAQGAHYAVLEVSSHGLDQGRVNGVEFDVAVFTNLSRDHLDYHGDLSRYGAAKRRLFEIRGLKHAVCNLDDEFGRQILESLPANVNAVGYRLDASASHSSQQSVPTVQGRRLSGQGARVGMEISTPWGDGELQTDLVGDFNAFNLLAALATLCAIGMPFTVAMASLSEAPCVPGRMERFGEQGGQPLVVVDYAHTPGALQQVLKSLRRHCGGRLWCVFGCGGDRDPGKRPMMGRVAEVFADEIVLTSDNPRFENPDVIIGAILSGIQDKAHVRIQSDRARAITEAIGEAGPNDVVVVAGKGHEAYQEIRSLRRPFSDRELVQSLLRGLHD